MSTQGIPMPAGECPFRDLGHVCGPWGDLSLTVFIVHSWPDTSPEYRTAAAVALVSRFDGIHGRSHLITGLRRVQAQLGRMR